ncbi:MAG TPA: RNB domain-containing ribonuclease, partial [Opitutus sp.]|nr:RNB domain-containing ribonuclease [Opitutus sp.]
MTLRERLLALLREPSYSPANESELLRKLGLHKKRRASLAHEIRQLLAKGEAVRSGDDRIRIPREERAPKKEKVGDRKLFTPTRRAAATPPVDAPAPSPTAKRSAQRAPAAARAPSPTRSANANEMIGRIQFRAGGSAFVVPENPETGLSDLGEPSVQIFPEDTDIALPGDRVLVRIHAGRRGKRPGERIGGVERILERGRESIVGDLRRSGRDYIVVPDDPRFVYEIYVADPARGTLRPAPQPGDKVVVQLDDWKHRRDRITGEITKHLGRTHEPRAELLGIFEKYNLSTSFPADVEREAAELPDRVPASALAHRLDYREKAVFTIDPDDAKDFDDALSYEVLDGGDVRIGIHIADVSTYVHAGTALDREAQRRGNSTYLVGVVIPMLPEKLSNGLCSLVEGQDRLCRAVFLTFAKNGRIKDTSFANTVIRSRKRLTYKQAYALLFENDLDRVRALPLPPKHQTGSTGRALNSLSDAELVDLQSWV